MGVFSDAGDKVEVVNEKDCVACKSCEAACPSGAITVKE